MSSGVSLVTATSGFSYNVLLDEVSTDLTYIGKAPPHSSTSDSVWQIKRLEKNGSVLSVFYADGNPNFDNIWDNRASINYS